MVLTTMDAHAPLAKLVSKAEELHRVLAAPTVDMWKLRELSLSDGGLVDGKNGLPCCTDVLTVMRSAHRSEFLRRL
jgi:hypothetical protein